MRTLIGFALVLASVGASAQESAKKVEPKKPVPAAPIKPEQKPPKAEIPATPIRPAQPTPGVPAPPRPSEKPMPLQPKPAEKPGQKGEIRPTSAVPAAAFVGDKGTRTYHRTDCRKVKMGLGRDGQSFASKAEAERVGYRPCSTCKP